MSAVLHRHHIATWIGKVAPLLVALLSLGLVGGMLFFPGAVTPELAGWVAALGMGLAAWPAVVREWHRGGKYRFLAGVLAALWAILVAWLSAWGARWLGEVLGRKSALGGLVVGFVAGMMIGLAGRGLGNWVWGKR